MSTTTASPAGPSLGNVVRDMVEVVRDAGLEWTEEEIADVLWLASFMGAKPAPAAGRQAGNPAGTPDAAPGVAGAEPAGEGSAGAQPGAGTQDLAPPGPKPRPELRHPRDSAPPPAAAAVDVHLPTQRLAPGAGLRAVAFRVPAATALPDKLLISRSLRPLLRRVPAAEQTVLDEAASANWSAELRAVVPVLRPGSERWLDVTVVVDEWHTMAIWRETVAELVELLLQLGAFRTVQTLHLLTEAAPAGESGAPDTLQLYAGSAPGGRKCDPRELVDPGGRRLILLATDCTSPAWANGAAAALLRQWSEQGMVTLVQMLPQRLWPGTALGAAGQVYVSATTPGTANSGLEMALPRFSRGVDRRRGQPLPVITLEPESLRRWARMLAGMGREFVPGYWLDPAPLPEEEAAPASLTPEELWRSFRAAASPAASELAGYLAAVPLSLQVMRLVQRVMVPGSRQVHLAEVIRSGLLSALPDFAPGASPAEIRYDFVPGVRSVLLDAVLRSDTRRVLREVSGYIAQHVEQWRSFHALVLDPTSAGDFAVDARTLPLATITAEVLRHLGGSYRQLAERLELGIQDKPAPAPERVVELADSPRQGPKSEEEFWDNLCRRIADARLLPILGGAVRLKQIFGLDHTEEPPAAGEAAAAAPKQVQPGEPESRILMDLSELWAAEIGYPLQESRNLARVAQYNKVIAQDPLQEKMQFLTFLKEVLLDLAEKYDPSVQEMVPQLQQTYRSRDLSFADIVAELDYPRNGDQQDPLRILARFPLPVYVTTGCFDFLERALQAEGKKPRTQFCLWNMEESQVAPELRPDPDYIPSREEPLVYHLFGVERYPQSLVLSEDDYVDFLLALAADSYMEKGLLPLQLRRRFEESSLLLLGFRLADWETQLLLNMLPGSQRPTYRSYNIAVQLDPRLQEAVAGEAAAREYYVRLFASRRFQVAWAGTGAFAQLLGDEWERRGGAQR